MLGSNHCAALQWVNICLLLHSVTTIWGSKIHTQLRDPCNPSIVYKIIWGLQLFQVTSVQTPSSTSFSQRRLAITKFELCLYPIIFRTTHWRTFQTTNHFYFPFLFPSLGLDSAALQVSNLWDLSHSSWCAISNMAIIGNLNFLAVSFTNVSQQVCM